MNLTRQREQMNEHHVRIVVRAALEDLVSARQMLGADSPAYARQVERSMVFIRGNLEAVLTAAQTELDRRAHGEYPPATGTD